MKRFNEKEKTKKLQTPIAFIIFIYIKTLFNPIFSSSQHFGLIISIPNCPMSYFPRQAARFFPYSFDS